MDHPACEMPDSNPPSDEIKEILTKYKRIAVVGLSDKPDRTSYMVTEYMISKGYDIVPVNPMKKEIFGKVCYPDLPNVPGDIDIVNIFRRVDAIPGVVDEAIKVKAKCIWMQLGLAHKESAEKARAAGLEVIQSKCIKIEYSKLF